MTIFNIDDDIKSFLVRSTKSLDKVDNVTNEATLLLREVRLTASEITTILTYLRKAIIRDGVTNG